MGGAMAFKVGDVVRLKFGGTLMTVSKLFKSPEGREMVQCTWFDKKPREHRAAFVIDSLEAAEQATLLTMQGARLDWLAAGRVSDDCGIALYRSFCNTFNGTPVVPVSLME
jgi:uncharacterized protein YodC (DUF2158 family)